MKTKIFAFVVLSGIFLSACTAPRYVPKTGNLDVNIYGSYIIVKPEKGSKIRGELLSVDTSRLAVLTDSGNQKKVLFVSLDTIKDFTLRYAQPKQYWWSIPAYTVICAFHGWWAALTVPVNLLLTTGITVSAVNVFKYHKDDISYNDLKMFARFPEGIPPDVVFNTKPKLRSQPRPWPGKK